MIKKDLIIGGCINYKWDQLKYWVNSIKLSGFQGEIVLITFNIDQNTHEILTQKGVKVVNHENVTFATPIHVERFIYMYNWLKDHIEEYRFVIATDVKDVIFQKNPVHYLMDMAMNNELELLASYEGLQYQDEPWGSQNLLETFGPYIHNIFKEKQICNVGVLAGWSLQMLDLFLHIYLMAINRPQPICDQAVFNVMAHSGVYSIRKTSIDDEWCINLGTTSDPRKPEFLPKLMNKPPIIGEGYVLNPEEEPFHIVHQYDRIPGLKEEIERIYGN